LFCGFWVLEPPELLPTTLLPTVILTPALLLAHTRAWRPSALPGFWSRQTDEPYPPDASGTITDQGGQKKVSLQENPFGCRLEGPFHCRNGSEFGASHRSLPDQGDVRLTPMAPVFRRRWDREPLQQTLPAIGATRGRQARGDRWGVISAESRGARSGLDPRYAAGCLRPLSACWHRSLASHR